MNQLLRQLARCLAPALLPIAAATAQQPNTLFSFAPLVALSDGTGAAFVNGLQPSLIDNAFNPVGTLPGGGGSMLVGDQVTHLGGSNYRLTLTAQGVVPMNPLAAQVNGQPATRFGAVLGEAIGYAIDIYGGEALFVASMDFYAYDAAGAVMFGPIDVTPVVDLYNKDYQGGWTGSALFTVPMSNVTGPISRIELVTDYHKGTPNDFWINWGSGCSPVSGAQPAYLDMDSAAVIGQPLTIVAGNVPYPTIGAWLVIGDTDMNEIGLDVLGGDPSCYLRITTVGGIAFMPDDPSGVFDLATTFTLPYDPNLVGAEFGMQMLGLYGWPSPIYNGFYVGDYAEVTIGG